LLYSFVRVDVLDSTGAFWAGGGLGGIENSRGKLYNYKTQINPNLLLLLHLIPHFLCKAQSIHPPFSLPYFPLSFACFSPFFYVASASSSGH